MPFDLQVFNKQTYAAMTETVAQDIEKFNEASQGAIQLINEPFGGDFNIEASFKANAGIVRRRNAYGTGTVAAKRLEQSCSMTSRHPALIRLVKMPLSSSTQAPQTVPARPAPVVLT